jgi:hypothetical protein
MGLTSIMVRISNPADRSRGIEAEMLMDSGAIFSAAPADELSELGIEPEKVEHFSLADGTSIRRPVGTACFEVAGKIGEPGDAWLLGALSLESLGLLFDPLKRELRGMRMPLYGVG